MASELEVIDTKTGDCCGSSIRSCLDFARAGIDAMICAGYVHNKHVHFWVEVGEDMWSVTPDSPEDCVKVNSEYKHALIANTRRIIKRHYSGAASLWLYGCEQQKKGKNLTFDDIYEHLLYYNKGVCKLGRRGGRGKKRRRHKWNTGR